jgi:hypothetical protein
MATNVEYCNLDKDLTDVVADIRQVRGLEKVDGPWRKHSGNIYVLRNSGYVEMVFENGRELASVDLTADPPETEDDITAGEFYYKASEDALYVETLNSGSPQLVDIHFGPDWLAMATRMRAQASEMVEGWLRSIYATPFQKVPDTDLSRSGRKYDYWIIKAVAKVTCALILRQFNHNDRRARQLMLEVNTPAFDEDTGPEDGSPGIIQEIRSGNITLNTQVDNRLSGGVNIFEQSSNTGNGYCDYWQGSRFSGSSKQIWLVEIDTAGDIDAATFKLSRDDGRTFDKTLEPVRRASGNHNRRISLGRGVEVEFTTDTGGQFEVGDKWRLICHPLSDLPAVQPAGNISLTY